MDDISLLFYICVFCLREIEFIFTGIDCSVPDCKNELKNGFLNQTLVAINGVIKIAEAFHKKHQMQSIEYIFEEAQSQCVILNMNNDFIYL